MSYMKLIKLLYLADRRALLKWGRPITGDQYFWMKKGPVLSRVHDLITEGPDPGTQTAWQRLISAPVDYEVSLLHEAPTGELSAAEEQLVDEIFAEFGRMNRWEIVERCHRLPESVDIEGGAVTVKYRDILKAEHKSEIEISAIEQEIEALALCKSFLPSP